MRLSARVEMDDLVLPVRAELRELQDVGADGEVGAVDAAQLLRVPGYTWTRSWPGWSGAINV